MAVDTCDALALSTPEDMLLHLFLLQGLSARVAREEHHRRGCLATSLRLRPRSRFTWARNREVKLTSSALPSDRKEPGFPNKSTRLALFCFWPTIPFVLSLSCQSHPDTRDSL